MKLVDKYYNLKDKYYEKQAEKYAQKAEDNLKDIISYAKEFVNGPEVVVKAKKSSNKTTRKNNSSSDYNSRNVYARDYYFYRTANNLIDKAFGGRSFSTSKSNKKEEDVPVFNPHRLNAVKFD